MKEIRNIIQIKTWVDNDGAFVPKNCGFENIQTYYFNNEFGLADFLWTLEHEVMECEFEYRYIQEKDLYKKLKETVLKTKGAKNDTK